MSVIRIKNMILGRREVCYGSEHLSEVYLEFRKASRSFKDDL